MALDVESRPARGVWIEIVQSPPVTPPQEGHAPQGACGLKSENTFREIQLNAVTPRKGRVD